MARYAEAEAMQRLFRLASTQKWRHKNELLARVLREQAVHYQITRLPYGVEPLVFETEFTSEGELLLETTRIRRISRAEALIESALVDTRLHTAAEKMREQEKEGA